MASSKDKKRRANRKQRLKHHHSQSREVNDYHGPQEYVIKRRAAKLAQIISKYPQQIALGLAKKDEAGWMYGCLYLVGAIDHDQKAAAETLDRVVSSYRKLLYKYHGAKISNPESESLRVGGGTSGEDLSPQAEKRWARASREYDKNILALRSCGEDVEKAVLEGLETDSLTNLDLVRQGLNALCRAQGRRSPSLKN